MPTRREMICQVAAGLGTSQLSFFVEALRSQSAPGVYTIPVSMTDIRIAMPVRIDGFAVQAAIDSGGQLSLIDKSVADQVRLSTIGSINLGIGGSEPRRYGLRAVKEVIFANQLRQTNVVFAETDRVRFGDGISASLAAGTLATFDSELDSTALELRIFTRGGPDHAGWTTYPGFLEPARIQGLSPLFKADAILAGRKIRAIIDTGALRPFIVTPELFAKLPTGTNWSPAFKDGNRILRTARLQGSASFGGLTIERPIVAAKNIGTLGTDMIIGLPLLQQLNLATSIRQNMLFARPSGRRAPGPNYNFSGLWIDRSRGQIVAGAVGEGSPAQLAGIRVGDVIDGKEFSAMIDALNGPLGSIVRLGVAGKSERRNVAFTLSDYL